MTYENVLDVYNKTINIQMLILLYYEARQTFTVKSFSLPKLYWFNIPLNYMDESDGQTEG